MRPVFRLGVATALCTVSVLSLTQPAIKPSWHSILSEGPSAVLIPLLPKPAKCESYVSKLPQYTINAGNVNILDSQFERVDQKLDQDPKFRRFFKNHAIHDTLTGANKVEKYEIYINKQTEELVAVIKFGNALNGHPGIVHGGILGLLIDNSFGILFLLLNKPLCVTANLNINYRNPTLASTQVVLYAKVDRSQGRKLFMTSVIEDAASHRLLVEASTLFIAVKNKWFDPFGLLPKLALLLA